jgi:sugar/nucleoside kinase (ribokinase family)
MGKSFSGLFVGLATLDFAYLVDRIPGSNQKIVARDSSIAAGGPATNAAVTFSYLGNKARLLGVIGAHPMHHLMVEDLNCYSVAIADLQPDQMSPPPISSILVITSSGERSVVSQNATKIQATADQIPADALHSIDIVLIDGHQISAGVAIARQAREQGIPVVVDGGSWKPGFEQVLRYTDYAICSADFHPPGCISETEVFSFLSDLGIPHSTITHGQQPIQIMSHGHHDTIVVPQIYAVDTTGAGDIFHGAFCHALLHSSLDEIGFRSALKYAAQVASQACQSFGTRQWMTLFDRDSL